MGHFRKGAGWLKCEERLASLSVRSFSLPFGRRTCVPCGRDANLGDFPPRNDLGCAFKMQASGFHPRSFDSIEGRGSQGPGFVHTLMSVHIHVGVAGGVLEADLGHVAL